MRNATLIGGGGWWLFVGKLASSSCELGRNFPLSFHLIYVLAELVRDRPSDAPPQKPRENPKFPFFKKNPE